MTSFQIVIYIINSNIYNLQMDLVLDIGIDGWKCDGTGLYYSI